MFFCFERTSNWNQIFFSLDFRFFSWYLEVETNDNSGGKPVQTDGRIKCHYSITSFFKNHWRCVAAEIPSHFARVWYVIKYESVNSHVRIVSTSIFYIWFSFLEFFFPNERRKNKTSCSYKDQNDIGELDSIIIIFLLKYTFRLWETWLWGGFYVIRLDAWMATTIVSFFVFICSPSFFFHLLKENFITAVATECRPSFLVTNQKEKYMHVHLRQKLEHPVEN